MHRLRLCAVGLLLLSLPLLRPAHAETTAAFELPVPYFGKLAAAQDFALERWQPARDGFAAALAKSKDPGERARLGFLVAVCDRRLGKNAEAAAGFDAAAVALPELADYARYHAAEAYYYAHDMDAVRDRAGKVSDDAILHDEAQLLVGDALRAQEKWADVASLYDGYLQAHAKGGIRLPEARYWLAQADEKLGRDDDALAAYRQITIDSPVDAWGEKAKARYGDLLKALPRAKRARLEKLSGAELISRGKVYFEEMRNELAEADFTAALKLKTLDKPQRCVAAYHLAQTVFKERQRARSAPLFDTAVAACARTSDADLQERSAYQGGRAWGSAGDPKKAIALFEKAASWHKDHSFADDALLRESEQWEILERQGDKQAKKKLTEILTQIPVRFPDGDMRGEAMWRLAWRAWKAKEWKEAVAWLEKEMQIVPHEDNYWAEGQAPYWIGRAQEQLGKKEAARLSYVRAVKEYPLSYYALLALNRLREGYPQDFDLLVEELKKAPAGWKAGTAPFQFAPRAVFADPAYRRAVELLRLGLGAAAERELSRAGLRPPEGRKKVTDPDQIEQLWAVALLYDRAGRYGRSHWMTRWSMLDYRTAWPTEANRGKWDIAYPRAFWPLVDKNAKELGYPPELLEAFIREESAFDPLMESFANAVGLTQMIQPTAARFGKDLGYDLSKTGFRDTLKDPDKNVAVGARWLAFLWTTYQKDLGLVVAGYNSGEGAVWRWLCDRGDWALDEFGEEIPYDETRLYTKRVLSSYFAYAYLEDGSIPALSNVIPAGAVNPRICKNR